MSKLNACKKQNQPLQMFYKLDILKSFANFTGKHLCWSLFLIKLKTRNLIKGGSNTGVILFYRTPPVAASKDQRKTRQVLSLKIIFLKELKSRDLCKSLLKTLFFRHDFIILFFFHID